MQKGTALVGFFLSFALGILVHFGITRMGGVSVSADKKEVASKGASDHSASPIPVTDKDPQWGKADALVTIVEISDFQCPFCTRVGPTMKQIKEKYGPDKVRIVWKHNPLPFHKEARPAHEASDAVFALGGSTAFWKFHDLAFENQKALTPENFATWAQQSGVDPAKFKAAFDSKKSAAKVDQDLAANKKIGATGTPAFRINGVTLSGAQPFDRFQAVIDTELKKAEDELKKGTARNQVSLKMTQQNFKDQPAAAKDAPEKKAEEDTTNWRVEVSATDPVRGPADALVTIVQWSDFQCPFCTRVEPTINELVKKYGNDLRIVWKDNPLPFHKEAKPAATVARLAYEKGGNAAFWKAHAALFENQKTLGAETYDKLIAELGLGASAKDAIASNKYEKLFAASSEAAAGLNARGTPAFFINGRRLSGAQPVDKFSAVIDQQMAVAKALVAKGVPRAKVYDELMKTGKTAGAVEKKEVPAPGKDNPVKGAKVAKVVINEFSDFECPFCSRVNPTMKQIMEEYGDKVQIVWRNMPLPMHQNARLAAEAAQEAFTQQGSDGFWKFHDTLFANQKALARPELEKYAEAQGLNMAKFKKALDEHTHAKQVDADVAIAGAAGISGTPAFTINGAFVSGAQPFEQFDKLIKQALAGK
jgi:protein-disulfide isomerase